MVVDPVIQAEFERNLIWKRSWPRCFLGMAATLEIFIGLVICLTEILNFLVDFWHTNVFGGIWAALIIFVNWILIFVTVCCRTTVGSSTCVLIWNFITLIATGILIAFDVVFILNPSTCLLTPTCSSQPQVFSLNSVIQTIPMFKNYSSYDSKRLLQEIQVGCAGVAFIISFIYIIIYVVCKVKINNRVAQDYSAPTMAPLPPPPPLPPMHYEYPIANAPPMPWPNQQISAPYAPY